MIYNSLFKVGVLTVLLFVLTACFIPQKSRVNKKSFKTSTVKKNEKNNNSNNKKNNKKLPFKYVGENNKYRGITNSIFVSNGIVYVAGGIKKATHLMQQACYWKNDKQIMVTIPFDSSSSIINGIFVYKNIVYMAGSYYDDKEKSSRACYWIGKKFYKLSGKSRLPLAKGRKQVVNYTRLQPGESYDANDIYVDDSGIYVTGRVGFSTLTSKACYFNTRREDPIWMNTVAGCYWKNEILYELPGRRKGGDTLFTSGSGYAITGNKKLIVVAYNGNDGFKDQYKHGAGVWKSKKSFTLKKELSAIKKDMKKTGLAISRKTGYFINNISKFLKKGRSVHDIAMYKNSIYVAGETGGKKAGSFGQACFWKNGRLKTLGKGTAKGIFVENNIVHIAGIFKGKKRSVIDSCYWKNGKTTKLVGGTDATSIYVEKKDVYISGIANYTRNSYYAADCVDYYNIPCYWKNGKIIYLPTGE